MQQKWGQTLEQLKELKVVFGDYNTDSFALANSKISNVNLYKKTNKLELFLQSQEIIPISEIEKFESYAKKRFNFNEVSFKISYQNEENNKIDKVNNLEIDKKIENDWKNILEYMSKKVPVIKAFLKQSEVDVKENVINVHLSLKGKEILERQNMDKYISDFIKDIYMTNYKINFIEENVEKTENDFLSEKQKLIKEFSENSSKVVSLATNVENKEAKKVYKNINWNGKEEQNNSYKGDNNWKNNNWNNNLKNNNSKNNMLANKNSENQNNAEVQANIQEDPTLIYGRNSNIKEQPIKVEDIGMDTTDVQLIGEIVNCPDPTELKKTGKFLFSFDVYDGTSTITCKMFLNKNDGR